jgi:hypothetical protein
LSLGFENTQVRVGERNHGAKIRESARQVTPLPQRYIRIEFLH